MWTRACVIADQKMTRLVSVDTLHHNIVYLNLLPLFLNQLTNLLLGIDR